MGKFGMTLVILSVGLTPGVRAADFSGNGQNDVSIFRPATGFWAVRGVTRLYFGQEGDSPVPGDYNGAGTARPAIFRPATGLWAVMGLTRGYFGRNDDQPEPGDYSGDGTDNFAIFRLSTGLWAVKDLTRVYFGRSGDIPVPADYRVKGRAEIAIFRPSTGLWSIRGLNRVYFGGEGDIPVPGDYYGFGSAEPAIFRPATGLWSAPGRGRIYFGKEGDQPKPGDYSGTGTENIAIYRPSTGLWAVWDSTRFYFGGQAAPTPLPLQWRDGYDVDTFEVENGVFEFWTRNIRQPSSPNHGGMYEYIICRLNGSGYERILVMTMYDRPTRIFIARLSEGDYSLNQDRFPQPLPGPNHWRVAADGSRVWVELDGEEIWSEQGRYTLEYVTMGGYAQRGFLGEWSSAD